MILGVCQILFSGFLFRQFQLSIHAFTKIWKRILQNTFWSGGDASLVHFLVFFLYLGAVVQKRVKLFPGAAWVCDDVMNDNGADRAFSNWRRIFFVELRQRLTIALTRVYCYILPTRSTAPYATCSIRQSTRRTRPTQYRATSPPPPQYRYTELATIVLKNARLRFDLSGLNRLFFFCTYA